MGTWKLIVLLIWVILGILNLTAKKITKGDYFMCWFVLILSLISETLSYMV